MGLELRHFITGGQIASPEFGLADMAVQSIAALGFTIGLQLLARRSSAAVNNRHGFVNTTNNRYNLSRLSTHTNITNTTNVALLPLSQK